MQPHETPYEFHERLRRQAAAQAPTRTVSDTELLACWENAEGGWLIGRTTTGQWQAASQKSGLLGRGVQGATLRDVLLKIYDFEKP